MTGQARRDAAGRHRPRGWVVVLWASGALTWLTALTGPASAQPVATELLPEDVQIRARRVHAFADEPATVTVLRDGAEIRVGQRILKADDAVIWTRQGRPERREGRLVTVYLEGDARIREPGGAVTRDNTMLVRFRHEGRFIVQGGMSAEDVRESELLARATTARQSYRAPAPPPAHRLPPLLIEGPPPRRPSVRGDADANRPTERRRPPKPERVEIPPPAQPVYFRADEVVSERADPCDPNQPTWLTEPRDANDPASRGRVTYARGSVYLSQGDTDAGRFVQMSAQSAVMFSLAITEPNAPDEADGADPLEAARAGNQRIVGVYLEGDVVIRANDREIRADRAYYDFLAERATLLDVVMRTVQEQRDVPIYIRSPEARMLSRREMWFRRARISTSDFYTPTYHIGAYEAYVMDATPRLDSGEAVGRESVRADLRAVTFNVRGAPVLFWPWTRTELTRDTTALRKIEISGWKGDGMGVLTEWHLARLLGVIEPEGFASRLELGYWCQKGAFTAVNVGYERDDYAGFLNADTLYDTEQLDDFGEERQDISAPPVRGQMLWRHKQILADEWLAQLEFSYLCDKNYLEQVDRREFYAGKPRETLAYVKRQEENWALTGLVKGRINRFLSQDLSAPEVEGYLIAEPLGGGATLYHESRLGWKKWVASNQLDDPKYRRREKLRFRDSTDWFLRADTRSEVEVPVALGPVKVVPYAMGRASWWGEKQEPSIPTYRDRYHWSLWDQAHEEGEDCRLYSQLGLRASTTFHRIYPVTSRFWDLNGIRHVVTPSGAAWLGATTVKPEDLIPLDADIEQDLYGHSGGAVAIEQRLQTKRGPRGKRYTVDWMRFLVEAGFYDNGEDPYGSEGDFLMWRPEYSRPRNHINGEWAWKISDSTMFLTDLNYDMDTKTIHRYNLGLAVQRDSRMRYFAAWRYIKTLDSAVGTVGVRYRINDKYTVQATEQYDFDYRETRNLSTSVSVIRRLPRWNVMVRGAFRRRLREEDEVTIMIALYPEGIPEVRLGGTSVEVLGRNEDRN